jgi:hypothetical protein
MEFRLDKRRLPSGGASSIDHHDYVFPRGKASYHFRTPGKGHEGVKLLIMPQSLSLCLMGYAWFGQASLTSLLKWSVAGLT